MTNHITIPSNILVQIEQDQPRLKSLIDNLNRSGQSKGSVQGLEKTLADNYLMAGQKSLSASKLWSLSKCCVGGPYQEVD